MARRFARPLAIALVVAIAIVSAATPFLDAKYYQAWFAWPGVLAAAQMPLLVAIDRKSTRLLQSLMRISYAVFCLKKKNRIEIVNLHIKINKHKTTISIIQ